jgi:8-oxo-dGTP diphosphatase
MKLNEQLIRMRTLVGLNEGKRYQSPLAAGALLVAKDSGKCLVGLRSKICDSPHTWGPFGGSIEEGETIEEGLLRELKEEIGFTDKVELHESWLFERSNFQYHTFIGLVETEFEPKINEETDEYKWLTLEELNDLPKKHHGFAQYVENAQDDLKKFMK